MSEFLPICFIPSIALLFTVVLILEMCALHIWLAIILGIYIFLGRNENHFVIFSTHVQQNVMNA